MSGNQVLSVFLMTPASAGVHSVSATEAAPARVATVATAVPGCGATPFPRPGGGYWACSFAENFNGSALDSTKWSRMVTAESGFKSGPECYLATGDNVRVGGGALALTVRKTAAPFNCVSYRGDYMSQYTGR